MEIPLERTKDVPKCTVGIITWLCEYTKRHWSICYANYILSELIPKPQNEKQQFSVLIFWMPCHLLWRAVWPPLTRINVKLKLRRKKLVIFVPDRNLSLRLGRWKWCRKPLSVPADAFKELSLWGEKSPLKDTKNPNGTQLLYKLLTSPTEPVAVLSAIV